MNKFIAYTILICSFFLMIFVPCFCAIYSTQIVASLSIVFGIPFGIFLCVVAIALLFDIEKKDVISGKYEKKWHER